MSSCPMKLCESIFKDLSYCLESQILSCSYVLIYQAQALTTCSSRRTQAAHRQRYYDALLYFQITGLLLFAAIATIPLVFKIWYRCVCAADVGASLQLFDDGIKVGVGPWERRGMITQMELCQKKRVGGAEGASADRPRISWRIGRCRAPLATLQSGRAVRERAL